MLDWVWSMQVVQRCSTRVNLENLLIDWSAALRIVSTASIAIDYYQVDAGEMPQVLVSGALWVHLITSPIKCQLSSAWWMINRGRQLIIHLGGIVCKLGQKNDHLIVEFPIEQPLTGCCISNAYAYLETIVPFNYCVSGHSCRCSDLHDLCPSSSAVN